MVTVRRALLCTQYRCPVANDKITKVTFVILSHLKGVNFRVTPYFMMW